MTTPRKPKRKAAVRKPGYAPTVRRCWGGYIEDNDNYVLINAIGRSPKECRKLAAWLLKAAAYLEAKEK